MELSRASVLSLSSGYNQTSSKKQIGKQEGNRETRNNKKETRSKKQEARG